MLQPIKPPKLSLTGSTLPHDSKSSSASHLDLDGNAFIAKSSAGTSLKITCTWDHKA